MDWEYATDAMLVKYFEHENVWAKKWERVRGADITIKDPQHGTDVLLAVYEAVFNGVRKRFAAGEVSNGLQVFFIPAP